MSTAEVERGTTGERPAPAGPVRVLFIGGLGRSGSTLLCETLRATGIAGNPLEHFEVFRHSSQPRQPREYFAVHRHRELVLSAKTRPDALYELVEHCHRS